MDRLLFFIVITSFFSFIYSRPINPTDDGVITGYPPLPSQTPIIIIPTLKPRPGQTTITRTTATTTTTTQVSLSSSSQEPITSTVEPFQSTSTFLTTTSKAHHISTRNDIITLHTSTSLMSTMSNKDNYTSTTRATTRHVSFSGSTQPTTTITNGSTLKVI